MNLSLMTNDINVDFYFHPTEIHKSEDEIKSCYFNTAGSLIALVTKSNIIKMLDFIGKCVIFTTDYFKSNDLIIHSVSWSKNSQFIIVTYEKKKTNISGIKKIPFNFYDAKNYFRLDEDNLEFLDTNVKETQLYSIDEMEDNYLLISGKSPKIFNFHTKQIFDFFKLAEVNTESDDENFKYKYSYILKDTCDADSFFLFTKELHLIFLLKEKNENNLSKFQNLMENISDKKLPNDQYTLTKWLIENLNEKLIIVDVYYISTNISNGEIINVQMNSIKNLVLINSSDRILRLFKYDDDYITQYQDYFDSVNRKKWLNAYFYTLKVNNTYQDLIVTALSDSNSLEFILIDIETGNFLKRLEPFKYQCSSFICHYLNHFTLVLISNKKLYNILGYFVNNWGAFAPKLKYIEENIEFIEEESFFDDFNKKLKNPPKKITDKNLKKIFGNSNVLNRNAVADIFFKYSPCDDPFAYQSQKDLNEVFQSFNESVEIHKMS